MCKKRHIIVDIVETSFSTGDGTIFDRTQEIEVKLDNQQQLLQALTSRLGRLLLLLLKSVI